jgi:hypothetical protein
MISLFQNLNDSKPLLPKPVEHFCNTIFQETVKEAEHLCNTILQKPDKVAYKSPSGPLVKQVVHYKETVRAIPTMSLPP